MKFRMSNGLDAKGIDVKSLMRTLVDLPEDFIVTANGLYNLAIFDTDMKYVAYIDLLDGKLEWQEDDE
jgi:tmRNA-binding protein